LLTSLQEEKQENMLFINQSTIENGLLQMKEVAQHSYMHTSSSRISQSKRSRLQAFTIFLSVLGQPELTSTLICSRGKYLQKY
jgi:hypothetical protein